MCAHTLLPPPPQTQTCMSAPNLKQTLTRTHIHTHLHAFTQPIGAFADSAISSSEMEMYGEVADQIRGTGTIALVDCS